MEILSECDPYRRGFYKIKVTALARAINLNNLKKLSKFIPIDIESYLAVIFTPNRYTSEDSPLKEYRDEMVRSMISREFSSQFRLMLRDNPKWKNKLGGLSYDVEVIDLKIRVFKDKIFYS